MKNGDCVALPGGTGHAHTVINNTETDVKLMVIGQINVPDDKIFYPLHPKRNEECDREGWFWHNHPQHKLGHHNGLPNKTQH